MLKLMLAALLAAGIFSESGVRRPPSREAPADRRSLGAGGQPDRTPKEQDWPFYGGDPGGMKYSPLNNLSIFMISRYRLICLDAATGRPLESFGTRGIVDLSRGLVWEINKTHYTNTSPPVVYKDLIILGNGVGDRLVYRNDPPGDVRAFDARTGRQVWSFRPIPQPGEFGNDTWGNDSWSYTGHTNVWPPITLDAERGLIYLPFGTPSNDFYGGRRPGANVFAESLVCLDAATGTRKWHYQIVHHGLWDYDNPSPPNLVTIRVDGRSIDAVVQPTKQANIARIGKPDRSAANPRASEVDAELTSVGDTNAEFNAGLPLLKPPYGHLVAIDLNHGTIKWRVPFGDTPSLRQHPALKGVALPPALGVAGAPGVIATAGGLVFCGGGGSGMHGIGSTTRAEVWRWIVTRGG